MTKGAFRFLLSTSLLLLLSSVETQASVVKQIKGKKVLIDLEGEDADIDQEFYLIDTMSGKKKALIKIKQLKNGRAVAEVIKGKAAVDQGLLPKEARSKKISMDNESESRSTTTSKGSYQRRLSNSYGIVGGYLMSAMNAKYSVTSTTGSTNMKGNNFGVGGFYNYLISDNMTLNFLGSYDMFSVSGNASGALCDSGTDTNCKVSISYLSAYGQLRYYLTHKQWRPWVGGGGGFLLKMSHSSNVLKPPSSNQVFSFAAGVDWQLSRNNYIPISFEYNLYPATATVSANMMVIRAGYAWNLK